MRWKKWLGKQPSYYFLNGNTGDLFNRHLLKYLYNCQARNTTQALGRLLMVGSVVHNVKSHDILCGIGLKSKGFTFNTNPQNIKIFGLRGPITVDFFKRNGYHLKDLKFTMDPGLMARFVFPENQFDAALDDQVVFIPHYRERYEVRKTIPAGIKFVDVDNDPHLVIKQILKSKLVYSSSLHGIVFAHAYNRPAIFVRPQTDEPLTKFEDYYLSVGLKMPKPLDSIHRYEFLKDSDTAPGLTYREEDFYFPGLSEINEMQKFS